MITEEFDVLLAGSTEAVKEIIDVGAGELVAVLETRHVVIDVVVLLDGFDNVALALHLQKLLSDHDVRVVDVDKEVAKITIVPLKVGRVTECTLVVGNGPLGGCHHAQVVVPVGVEAGDESVLSESTLLDYDMTDRI